MNCSKCNALIPDDAAFCPECGAPVESPAVEEPVSRSFCPNCGAELQGDAAFCGNCGERLTSPAAPKTTAGSAPKKARTGKKFPFKKLLLAVAALAVLAAAVLLVGSLFKGGSDHYVVYIKENQLQYGEWPKMEEVQQLTAKLYDSGNDEEGTYGIWNNIQMTEDGKKLFYPDRVEYDEYGSVDEFTLYYRYINNPKKEAVKIDSGISYYEINKDGTMVYYLKNENLYQHDMKDKTKMDSDVWGFKLSEDEKSLLYVTYIEENDGSTSYNVYVMNKGEEPEKILSGISELEHVSQDLSMLVFSKNDSLYIKRGDEDPVKIASDISYVLDVYETGEVYYVVREQEEFTYWELIDDDMYDEDYTEYFSEFLSEYTIYNPMDILCYYNGEESVVVAENMVDWHRVSGDRAVWVYDCYEGEDIPKMKLSEYVDSYPDMYTWFTDALEQDTVSYIAIGGAAEELDVRELSNVYSTDDGSVLYLSAEYDDAYDYCSLYKLVLGENSVESCDLLDDDVYWRIRFQNNSILYFKDVEEGEGELYLNGNYVDDDVATRATLVYQQENVYYMKDYNEDKELGTLMYYDGKDAVTVKDDVYLFQVTEDNAVLYLYDYNKNHKKGELWLLDGKKSVKLDEDVAYIVLAK